MASDTYTVERGTTSTATAAALHERIVDLRRWRAWSPWEDLDPELQRTYGGADRGVGATYEWSGNRRAGVGRMEVTDVVPDEQVTIDLHFQKPFRSSSTIVFRLDPMPDGTEVTWTMTGPVTLMTRVMGLFTSMDRVIGPDFERGLQRLTADAEAATT